MKCFRARQNALKIIDGSGHYKGHIHSAVGRDANENMFPITWAVCEAESKETWTWACERF
ncbi:hypothetical protein QQ045_020124 [Rhodiola kirilowii]